MELGQTRRDRREREGGSADREREAFAVVTYFSTMTIYYLFVTEQILDKHQTRRGSAFNIDVDSRYSNIVVLFCCCRR